MHTADNQNQVKQRSPWHALETAVVLAAYGADARRGLSSEVASERLSDSGPNRLVEERQVTFWKVAREEVAEPMILLLLVVGVLYAALGGSCATR